MIAQAGKAFQFDAAPGLHDLLCFKVRFMAGIRVPDAYLPGRKPRRFKAA